MISLLLVAFSCNNQISSSDPKAQQENYTKKVQDTFEFRILTSGLPPDPKYVKALSVVEKKWGIQYYPVAGCIVSKELEDSMNRWNNVAEKRIEAKYGKDWWKTFHKEVEAQMIQDSIVANAK